MTAGPGFGYAKMPPPARSVSQAVLSSSKMRLLLLLAVARVGRAWTGSRAGSSAPRAAPRSAPRGAPLRAEENALSRAVGDVHGGKYNFDPTYAFGRDDGTSGARLPSARRYANRRVTPTEGIAIPAALHEEIVALTRGEVREEGIF